MASNYFTGRNDEGKHTGSVPRVDKRIHFILTFASTRGWNLEIPFTNAAMSVMSSVLEVLFERDGPIVMNKR